MQRPWRVRCRNLESFGICDEIVRRQFMNDNCPLQNLKVTFGLLLCVLSDPLSDVLRTYGNAPTLLLISHPLNLSETAIIISYYLLKNYYSNLVSSSHHSALSISRVIKSRLTAHLCSNILLNTRQSVYCKHHSTETALVYIYDHLVNVYVFLICLPLLTPLITTSYLLVFRLGLTIIVLLLNGSGLSYLVAPFKLNVTKISLLCSTLYAVFPKALFLVLYFSSSILPLSVPSFRL